MFVSPILHQVSNRSKAQVQRLLGKLSKFRAISMIETVLGHYIHDITQANKPSFQANKIDANQVPDPEKYRDTWESAKADVTQLLANAKELANGLRQSITQRDLAASLIQHRIREVESRIQAAELFSDGSAKNVSVVVIDFKDPSIRDESLIIGKPAEQDTVRGVLTSGVSRMENRTANATVVPVVGDTSQFPWGHGLIGTKSNGLPGNTHEVIPAKNPGQSQYKYEFVGEQDAHVNYGAILDQATDTWFEYEAITVPQSVIQETKGYGWAWQVSGDKTLTWVFPPPPDGVLRLTLRIHFNEPVLANEIIIHPYIPPNEGAKPPILKSVRVIDRGDTPNANLAAKIIQGASGQWTLTFPSQYIQTLDVSFEQPHAFPALIGHWAFWRHTVIQRTKKYLFGLVKDVSQRGQRYRVDGQNPPITMLGVTENPSSMAELGIGVARAGTLAYAVGTAGGMIFAAGSAAAATAASIATVGLSLIGVGLLLAGLFGSTEERVLKDKIEVELEAFEGKRWCIGLREIEVLSKVYEPTSMWVSKAFQAAGPIRAIRLEADERIPNKFPKGAVKYEVSVDDGETWYAISPSSYWDGTAPEILYVGSPEAIEGDPNRVGVIPSEPSSSIRLRIILQGSPENPYESAIIERVMLWVHTEA